MVPCGSSCQHQSIPCREPQPAPIDKHCLITGATQIWCYEENKCVKPSTCKSFVEEVSSACLPDAHGCIPCDGMVPCGSSCQHVSIPCREPQPAPIDKDCLITGATRTWCEEENKCVTPSTCKSFVEQNPILCLPDAHGCIPCDGMVPCGSSCQHGSIPCVYDENPTTVGGCAGTEFGCCPEHSWHPDKQNPGPNKPKHVGCYYYDLEEVEEQKAEEHIAYR